MRKPWIWISVIIASAVLGVGAAAGASRTIRSYPGGFGTTWWMPGQVPFSSQPGAQPGWQMGPGMMNPGSGWGRLSGTPPNNAQRISIDQAVELAKTYASNYGQDLQVSEVMEFSENFYAVVKEASTGRGAFELLIDPYTGAVYPEYGPNMMWNSKYSPMGGMMGSIRGGDNTLSLDQAVQAGQKYLDANQPGAKLETDGVSFYGHYTFDYKVNDKIAGMLSVNGINGAIWLHTWHGDFVQELEVK